MFELRLYVIFYNSSMLSWPLSTGNGIMCAINRSSIFILLSVQIHLCDLSRALYAAIIVGTNAEYKTRVQTKICRVLSMVLPILLLVISYGGWFFVWVYVYIIARIYVHHVMKNAYHQLKVLRRLPITTTSIWRGMHFLARWGWPIYGSALAWELCHAHVKFWDLSVFYLGRFSDMDTEWGNEFLLYFTLIYLLFSLMTFTPHRFLGKGLLWWELTFFLANLSFLFH